MNRVVKLRKGDSCKNVELAVVIEGGQTGHFTGFGCVRVRVPRGFPQTPYPDLYFQYFLCVFDIFNFFDIFQCFSLF